MRKTALLLAVFLSTGLAGCGQGGDDTLPDVSAAPEAVDPGGEPEEEELEGGDLEE